MHGDTSSNSRKTCSKAASGLPEARGQTKKGPDQKCRRSCNPPRADDAALPCLPCVLHGMLADVLLRPRALARHRVVRSTDRESPDRIVAEPEILSCEKWRSRSIMYRCLPSGCT